MEDASRICLPRALARIQASLKHRFGDALEMSVSAPFQPDGIWFLDVHDQGYGLSVQFSEALGFGVSAMPGHFGDGPDERFGPTALQAVERRVQELIATRGGTIPSIDIRHLRGDMAQVEAAAIMGIRQSSYSKREAQPLGSLMVETLERTLEAMDARLVLLAQDRTGRYFVLRDQSGFMPSGEAGATAVFEGGWSSVQRDPLTGLVATMLSEPCEEPAVAQQPETLESPVR